MNQLDTTSKPQTTESVTDSITQTQQRVQIQSNGDFEPKPQRVKKKRSSLKAVLLRRLMAKAGNLPVRVVLPGGEEILPRDQKPVGTIRIHDSRMALAIAFDPIFQFGEAYSDGRVEIEGDMTECLTVVYRIMNRHETPPSIGKRLWKRLRNRNGNSLKASQYNIHHHYDIGNDFYQLWLDKQMLYTCAYFPQSNMTLEQAQIAKMDHVCRKLRLRPGMRVADAGCGWGALAIHMAKHFDVSVDAYNISSQQVNWARQRAKQEGLQGKVEFHKADWRQISGSFDRFVSVGMLEHVGVINYQQLGETIRGCLHPEGIGLIHTIGRNWPAPLSPWIERRIFPGAHPPSLSEVMQIFETEDFSVLDVENLRLHYAETLKHWLSRYEQNVKTVREQFGERFVRMWRLYLTGSVAAFASGCLQLFQIQFAPGESNCIPRSREYLYDPSNEWRLNPQESFESGISPSETNGQDREFV